MAENTDAIKALQKLVGLDGESFETCEKIGAFLAKLLGVPIAEVATTVRGRLYIIRCPQAIKLIDDVQALLEKYDIKQTRPVAAKFGLAVFEQGYFEDEPTRAQLWANLLFRAMNPGFNRQLRYGFIDMLNSVTDTEVSILKLIYEKFVRDVSLANIAELASHPFEVHHIIHAMLKAGENVSDDAFQVALHNLIRMGCLAPHMALLRQDNWASDTVAIFGEVKSVVLTPVGLCFIEACL